MGLLQNKIKEGMWGITWFGSWGFVIAVLFMLYFLDIDLFWKFLLGLLLIEVIGDTIKALFHKQRPNKQTYKTLLEKIDAGAWPSQHSARAAFSGMGLWMYFDILALKVFAVLFALLVCYSRIYLKKHDEKDVLSGLVFGLVVGYLVFLL